MPTLIIFIGCYLLFVLLPRWRSVVALSGVAVLILLQEVSVNEVMYTHIHWNVIALFFGTLILAELFMKSHMPAVIAEWVVDHTVSARSAILAICILSSFLSVFVENVAVVLLLAPVTLKLCHKLEISPFKPMIFLAMFSNIQGTATLIGDPPSMILAGYLKMNFLDFFIYEEKIGIFFFVQAGALAASLLLLILLKEFRQPIQLLKIEKARSLIPSYLLIALVAILCSASHFDPGFHWFAGTVAMTLASVGILWYQLFPRWTTVKELITSLDWDTTFFLIGMFALVGTLIQAGWIDALSEWISHHLPESLLGTYMMIILFSVAVSAVVDNVPFLLTMIPVVQNVSDQIGAPLPLLMFALLIGSCLGGNITPIGAMANIVAVGILRKDGMEVSFSSYTKYGGMVTAAAVGASSVLLWFVWT